MHRNLLKVLQKTFNGEPGKITEEVELKESLQMHSKDAFPLHIMVTGYNCGSIWDYEWEKLYITQAKCDLFIQIFRLDYLAIQLI